MTLDANGRPVCSLTGSASMSARMHQHRARAVLHHRDDAGLADMLGHVEAELAHFRRELGRRAHFLHRQFGVGVEVAIQRHQLRHVGADRVRTARRRRRAWTTVMAQRRAHSSFFINALLTGTSSITSSCDSKCGLRHHQPPAVGADPLDIAGDVARSRPGHIACARVSSPSTSVPRKTWRIASPGKIRPT